MADAVRDLCGYEGRWPRVQWPGNARIAVSLVINYEEGSESSVTDGDPAGETTLAEVPSMSTAPGLPDLAYESMYEYGTRAGFHRLMNICRSESVPATFFACALAFERNPLAAKEVVRSGHDIVCHGYRWEDVTKLSEAEEREHIRLAVESLERTTGSRPTGWYCRYGPSARTRRLLVEEGGFRFDCDAYNDDLPYWTTVADRRHLVVPYSLNNNDARFARNEFGSPKDFEEHLKYTFDRLYIEGAATPKMMSVGLHLRIAGQPARALALRNFIRYVKSFPDVWFARRSEIADYWYKEQQ